MSSGFSLWKCASTAAMLRATICSTVRVLVTTLSLVLVGVRALTLGGICDNSKACPATTVQRLLKRQPGAYARRAGRAKSRWTPGAACSSPVIHEAGDLSIGGIGRKIADLAER